MTAKISFSLATEDIKEHLKQTILETPSRERVICKTFGCAKVLTLEEKLCGDYCQGCSKRTVPAYDNIFLRKFHPVNILLSKT